MEALIGAPAFHPCGHRPHRSGREYGYDIGTPGQAEPSACSATFEDHSLLVPHFKELSLEVGSLLQEAGEPVEFVYFPHEGMISLLAVMADGQGIETATVGTKAWLEPCRGSAFAGLYEGSRPGAARGLAHFHRANFTLRFRKVRPSEI